MNCRMNVLQFMYEIFNNVIINLHPTESPVLLCQLTRRRDGIVWLDGRVVEGAGLGDRYRSRVQIPAVAMLSSTLGKLFTHMYLCQQAV